MLQYSRKITIKHVGHAQLINDTTLRYIFESWGITIRKFIQISCWRILVQELCYS